VILSKATISQEKGRCTVIDYQRHIRDLQEFIIERNQILDKFHKAVNYEKSVGLGFPPKWRMAHKCPKISPYGEAHLGE
jgi:hypothetical protein